MYTVPSSGHEQKASQTKQKKNGVGEQDLNHLQFQTGPWPHTGQSFQDGP